MRGWIGAVGFIVSFGITAAEAQPLLLDDFTQGPTSLEYPGPLSTGTTESQSDLEGVIGGGRYLQIGAITGSDTVIESPVMLTINPDATDGRIRFQSAVASEGSALSYLTLRWPFGEGLYGGTPLGLDATQHGNAFRIQNVRSNLGDPGPSLPFAIYHDSVSTSMGTALPLLNRDDPYDLIIPFSRFGSSDDFTNLDRIFIGGGRLRQNLYLAFDAVEIVEVLPGDANGDGMVSIADLGILAANWQQEGYWAKGDFNADGIVNVADLGIVAANWQAGADGPEMSFAEAMAMFDAFRDVVVPEPAVAGASLLLAIGLLHRRARTRGRGAPPVR